MFLQTQRFTNMLFVNIQVSSPGAVPPFLGKIWVTQCARSQPKRNQGDALPASVSSHTTNTYQNTWSILLRFSHSGVPKSFRSHGLQDARLHCSSPLTESAQTHVHWVGDAIQPSHPLSSPSPLALNVSQHQGLFTWVGSSHQVTKVLELQLQHQSFQWIFRVDFL